MLPAFPNTKVRSIDRWSNYSGTIDARPIPIFCEIESGPDDDGALRRHADSVRAILRHCFSQTPPLTVRTIGSTWSFSKVIEPGQVVIDPGNLCYIGTIPHEHSSVAYQARAAQGFTPIFAEGGTGIGTLNQAIGQDLSLALQTSGAGNGHRLGGCIATGTHGSALEIGALHDTVLALYLIVGPDEAVFVQRGTNSPFAPSAATWLAQKTGIPTRNIADDGLFHAAQVSLGSLGFVFGVIVETTKLYRFQIKRLQRDAQDPLVREAIGSLRTSALHPTIDERPYHFDVVMHPYPPDGKKSWFVTLMWRRSAAGVAFASPLPGIPRTSSDTMGLIATLAHVFSALTLTRPLTLEVVRDNISSQLGSDASPEDSVLFPGQVFGPTTLPAGEGASSEIVVDHTQALAAIDTVQQVVDAEGRKGNFLLGCIAVRFVPKTRALLGMNQFDRNCFIELPSVRNPSVLEVYRAIWAALEAQGINFTCHWGQLNGFTPASVARYFGAHVAEWKAARRTLLGHDTAMQVFASKILSDAGLDG